MSEAAAQYHRIVDAFSVGPTLAQDDAASILGAFKLAKANGIPLELALGWPSRWRDQVRIREALLSLPELRLGQSYSGDARAISMNPAAMKQITAANRGKKPSKRTLERWLAKLGRAACNFSSEALDSAASWARMAFGIGSPFWRAFSLRAIESRRLRRRLFQHAMESSLRDLDKPADPDGRDIAPLGRFI